MEIVLPVPTGTQKFVWNVLMDSSYQVASANHVLEAVTLVMKLTLPSVCPATQASSSVAQLAQLVLKPV